MQVEIKMDSAYTEPKVILMTASMTEEVQRILKKLSEDVPQIISGSRDEKIEVLHQEDLLRLYELEERLDDRQFVRISNSEIINLRKVDHFDLSFTGTICVSLSNGTTTYASRRYVSRIKKILGI